MRYDGWDKVLADSRIVQGGGVPDPLPEGAASSIMEGVGV